MLAKPAVLQAFSHSGTPHGTHHAHLNQTYILRALCEWCSDNSLTPHILVWVNEHTRVPMQYVRDNEIMLNIGATATQNLQIDNDWISFSARFSGQAHDIWIPVGHVLSLFARETGEGMGFELEAYRPDTPPENTSAETAPRPAKKGLKLVK